MSIAKELLIEKAKEGYTVCYVDECPLRTQCLRWQAFLTAIRKGNIKKVSVVLL